MPIEPNYCAKCGHTVATRTVDGRARVVCPVCETIFYENPVPVAAAVVLNERREVLLVKRKRQPHRGMWCLPMGFAEVGETIAEAALRELKEEAGITGRVLWLLDADSFESGFYGELLIVTFEVEKVGGAEQPGDDAEETRYFPLEDHPPLAFSSNAKALRTCVARHCEDWAIRDSFVTLQSDEEKTLLSDDLVAVIQRRAEEVAELWLADVRANPTTQAYQTIAPQQLKKTVAQAISMLGRWLRGDEAPEEVKAFYQIVAEKRKTQGFEVHEILSAIALLKKHVWDFARREYARGRPIDAYRMLELSRRMALFFDKATYHAVRTFATG